MIGEVTATVKAIEVTAKAAETAIANAAAKETAKEIGKAAVEKSVDITKRIDVTAKAGASQKEGVDIAKRIKPDIAPHVAKEMENKDLSKYVKEYISDLKTKSDVAETLKDTKLDISKLDKVPPEKVKQLREEFDDNKAKLRREWEQIHKREWPKYEQDVYSKNEVMVRKKGDCYDAHHIHPLGVGGKNEASNITPLDINKHKEIHSTGGSCTNVVEKVAGR